MDLPIGDVSVPAAPLTWLDYLVLGGYLLSVTGFGCWFFSRNRQSEHFMSAGRSLPGWAVGLSIFGSYVSSISFLANPGKSYATNWNAFVFALSLPLAAWIAVRYFVPFYRASGHVSAYEHLEHRFGAWACTYAVVCFLLIQVARLGTILYLLGLALAPLFPVELWVIIVVLGMLITVYPFLGGTEGVIWTGVVQSLVLIAGPLICLVVALVRMPEGLGQVWEIARDHHKFSLGSLDFRWDQSTFWVVLLYGLVTNLQNFGIDQAYVQRYVTARSPRDAAASVWLGASLYLPIGAAFFLIGTVLFAFYQGQPELLPEHTPPDAVFPWFIQRELPAGMRGLVLAALCAAAMDSNLNCVATLFLCNLYRRYFRPKASERESMRVLRWSTLTFGALSIAMAVAMIGVKNALDAWWELAGIFSGGMLGLFLLGRFSARAGNVGAALGTVAGVILIAWMTFSPKLPDTWSAYRSPFHGLLTMVLGTATVLLVGWLGSLAFSDRRALPTALQEAAADQV